VPEQRELAITRIALLELKDERQLVQEGYRLLDEKRILLASEIRRQLAQLREHSREMHAAEKAARAAVVAALLRDGLDALAVHPPASLTADSVVYARSRLLGLQLIDARLIASATTVPRGMAVEAASEEVRACIHTHRALLARAVALAATSLSLRRLVREYVRTERRTRAIENILLPEIESAVRGLEEQLDGMDQEEFARLRQRRHGRAAALGATTAESPDELS